MANFVSLRTILIILYIVLCGTSNFAQTNSGSEIKPDPFVPFTIKKFGTKEGLPQNQIYEIDITKKGELLLSTGNGLILYNGASFYPTPFKGSPYQFAYSRIEYVGDRTFGFGGNIIHQLQPQFQEYTHNEGDSFTLLNEILYKIDVDGNIYRSVSFKDSFELIASTGIKSLPHFYGVGNNLFFLSRSKTYSFNIDTKAVNCIFDGELTFIETSPNKQVLCSQGHNLYTLETDLNVNLISSFPKHTQIVNAAFLDKDRFWLTTSSGLVFYNGKTFEIYGQESGIPYTTCIFYLAEEDCLFLGTRLDGFYQLKLKSTRSIGNAAGNYRSVNNIIQEKNGKIYVAAWESNFLTLNDRTLKPSHIKGIAGSCSANILNDTLYVGIWNKGYQRVFNGEVVDHVLSEYGQCNASILDNKGNYWFGMNKNLLSGKNPRTVKPFHPEIFNSKTTSLFKLENGTVCVGQEGSFHLISPKGNITKHTTVRDKLSPKKVRCFFEDSDGTLWIGTYGDGLFQLKKNGELLHVNSIRNSELSNDIFTLVLDKLGNLVMTSNKGIYSVPLSTLQNFADGKIDYLIPFILEEESGMLSSEFNGQMNINYAKLPNDQILFPSIKGVTEYTPVEISDRKLHPYILRITADDSIVSEGHIFPRETINIEFSVFASSYVSQYNLKYQYKLSSSNNSNADWSELKSRGEISFTLLPPGNYVLHVRTLDGLNDPNPIILKHRFTIESYYYEETWFQISVLVLIAILLIVLLYIWARRIKAKEQREQAIKNTISDFRLQAIQSKMNPHFIFNSLNGIYHMMSRKKHKEAETMLLDFAKFLRKFIEQDSRNSNELHYEFDFLRDYLKVEQKRIRKGFDIRIELPDSISKRLIPASILMPFIENAVHHGIFHSPNKCFISIKAVEHKYGIKIFISDNGIGMDASKKINAERENHESKGIHFVKKKIELFEDLYNIKIKLRIGNTDLETHVSLFIPFYD